MGDYETANKIYESHSDLSRRMNELQVEKMELDKKIRGMNELLQNFEIENKNLAQVNHNSFDSEKNISYTISNCKAEKLAALEAKSIRYREESLELNKKIEDVRDKISKSNQIMQQLNSNGYDSAKDDRLLLENNLKRLNQRQKDFESEYSEVIDQLRRCNREIESLENENNNLEEDDSKELFRSNDKTSTTLVHRAQSQDKKDLLNLIRDTKLALETLNNRYKQVDIELAEAEHKTHEIKTKSYASQRDSKLDFPQKLKVDFKQIEEIQHEVNQMNLKECSSIAEKLTPIIAILKNIVLSVYNCGLFDPQQKELAVFSLEDLLAQFDTALKKCDAGLIEEVLTKTANYFEKIGEIKSQLAQHTQIDQDNIENKLLVLQEKLQEKIRQEHEISRSIELKHNDLERINVTISNETNIHTDLYESAKTLYQRILSYRKQIKTLAQSGDFEKAFDFPDEIENEPNPEEKIEEIAFWIQKILKYLNSAFERVQSFNEAKSNFLKEFERETKDLSAKWKDLENRKNEFRNRIQEEKDDFKRQMETEYKKFEKERSAWRTESEMINQYKRGLDEELQRLIEDRESLAVGLKKDQEKKDVVRKNFESQVQSFEKELKSLRAEIEEEEGIRQRIKGEYTEIQRLSELEFRRHTEIKEDLTKIFQKKKELDTANEEQSKKLETTRRDRQTLQEEITNLKKRMDEAGDEYKTILEQLKTQEKSLKKTIEALGSEIEFKKKACGELEIRTQEINDRLTLKEQTIVELENLIQEFQTERELHRKQKQDSILLHREIEQQNLKLEENNMKIQLQEGQLESLKKQSENLIGLIKEKQIDLQHLEKKIHQTVEKSQEAQFKLDRIEQTLNIKQEDAARIDVDLDEKIKETERINQKFLDLVELGRSKERALEDLNREITTREAEMQEFGEIIEENDQKYKAVIKENRETLEHILKDLKQKEDEYHHLLVNIDKLAQQRSEMSEVCENIESEAILKEDQMKRIADNLTLAQAELSRIHENILILTEQESQLETKLESTKNQEKQLADSSREMSQKVLKYYEQEEELKIRIQELQVKEDSVYVLMALSGEKITLEMEEKIKKMVDSHSQVLELEKTSEMFESENKMLKNEINQLRRRLNSYIKTGQHVSQPSLDLPLSNYNPTAQIPQSLGNPVFFNTAHEMKIPQQNNYLLANINHNRRASYSDVCERSQIINGTDAIDSSLPSNVLGPLNFNTEYANRKLEEDFDSTNTRRSVKGRIVSNPINQQSLYASSQGLRDQITRRPSENKENIEEEKAEHITPHMIDKNPDSKFQNLMSQLKEAHNQIVTLSQKEDNGTGVISFENVSIKRVEEFSSTFNQVSNQLSPMSMASAHDAIIETMNFGAEQNLLESAKFKNLDLQGIDPDMAQENLLSNEEIAKLEGFGLNCVKNELLLQ